MFEVGRYYSVSLGTRDDYENTYGECVDWAHPLLKLREVGKDDIILNTANPSFYKAELAAAPGERPVMSDTMGTFLDHIKND